MLSICILRNPLACAGEEKITLFVGINILNNIVIDFAEGIVDFAPVVAMIGAVFICNRVIIGEFQPQFHNMNILINCKFNQHFLVCTVNDLESCIGRRQHMLGGEVYVDFPFAEQLDRISVFVFTELIYSVTFRAKAEMIGNHTTLTVIKCFVGCKQCF